jgi:RNA recognition motif-containing protein
MINIYVGNLPYSADDQELRSVFEAYGDVKSAKVIKDMATGRSKGFGFVEMSDKDSGMQAIEALNDSDMGGRNLRVNEARPRERNNGPRF